jgi:hypothetical protein
MFSCSYFDPSSFLKNLNFKQHVLVGYISGVTIGLVANELYSNKWEKYYNKFSYTKTLFNFWSINGLLGGLYIGYKNK